MVLKESEERQIKARQIPTEIMETEAMTTDTWKGPNFQLRHLYSYIQMWWQLYARASEGWRGM